MEGEVSEVDYLAYVPATGGYQNASRSFHTIFTSADFDKIEFGFGGGNFYDPSNAATTPTVQVYKQLRAPAT